MKSEIPIDWLAASGWAIEFVFEGANCTPPVGETACMTILGMLGDGVLSLDEFSTVSGRNISGSLQAVLYESLF